MAVLGFYRTEVGPHRPRLALGPLSLLPIHMLPVGAFEERLELLADGLTLSPMLLALGCPLLEVGLAALVDLFRGLVEALPESLVERRAAVLQLFPLRAQSEQALGEARRLEVLAKKVLHGLAQHLSMLVGSPAPPALHFPDFGRDVVKALLEPRQLAFGDAV